MRKSFGEILKATRTAQNLSINQLAEASGVSAAHISRLENELRDVPKPDTIKKLTAVLGNYEELMEAAGYILNADTRPEPEDTFHSSSALNPVQEDTQTVPEGARKIIDSLARARDLDDEDFDVIADQVERLIAYAKKKRNTPPS
jgi:transcriptional regulator with XRE-family HTH domain